MYYVRAYATNSVGTAYGNQQTFTTNSLNAAIGQSYQGGIIAYFLQPGDMGYDANVQHGLIAASGDQGTVQWGCYIAIPGGADGASIGFGAQNTINIMNGCSEPGIAARLCGDLVLGGYSDWYLPSQDELTQLYLNRVAIGGFTSYYYWSSTEGSSSYASALNSNYNYYGGIYYMSKWNAYNVRAVRSF
jgi:hypothetical protein